eukprot:14783480-Alexandrium_andersonii.AAC.1
MASKACSPGMVVDWAAPASRQAASWRTWSRSPATSRHPAATTAMAARLPPSCPTSLAMTCSPEPSPASASTS